MRFSRSTLYTATAATMAALFFGDVSAQNSSSSDPSQDITTPSGNVMTHVIQVGDTAGTKAFYPEKIRAKKGDLVQFHFYPKEHSIAQGSFDQPCQPLGSANGSSSQGFWSGFMPVAAESKTMPVFSILVNDTKPIWFYCATMSHCQQGMAGVINEPEDKTLEQYKEAAMLVTQTGIPQGAASGGSNGTEEGLQDSPASNIPSNASDAVGAPGASSGSSPVGPTAVPSAGGTENNALGLFVSHATLSVVVIGTWFLALF